MGTKKDVPTISQSDQKKKDEQRSPLDGLLEDPKPSDHGVGSLDKALWDETRTEPQVERTKP